MTEGTRSYQAGNLGNNAIVQQGEHLSLIITRSDREELKEYLTRAVSAYERDKSQAVLRMSIPPYPYKFLDPFGLKDEPIFFGREAVKEQLSKKVLSDRLTVLHAKSGAGKTSLLNAGVSPRFIREGRLPLYVHAYYKDEDPVLAIKRTITSAVHGPWPRLLHDLPLHEFLGLVCECLSRDTQELIVMLDQFEQFFLLWSQPEARYTFVKASGTCYDDQSLPLRFIIALRKDYYSDLGEFERVLPHLHVFQNEYWLDAMTKEEAQEAILRPLAKLRELGVSVTYEPALLETLLADLTHDQIELPLLQIICTRLYETRETDEMQITLKTYEALGRAEGVLSHYLSDVLAHLPGKEESLARSVLKELVRSDATKQVLSYRTLAARVEAKGDELDHVLAELVNVRLLSREEMVGKILYELAHEYLTTEIIKWVSSADQEFKQAEELLQREVTNWRIHHMLIPRSRLEVLYTYRERFKGLDAEAWECLVSSALAEDLAVADWAKTADDIGELALFQALKASDAQIRRRGVKTLKELRTPRAVEPLIAALKDEDTEVRQQAARALGTLGDPRAVEPLIAIAASKDEDRGVREQAAEILGALGDPRAVEPLIAALKNEAWWMQRQAAGALRALRDPQAVEPLIAALKDEDTEVRQQAAEILGALGDPQAVEPLIAALKDGDRGVREQAARALRALGDPRAVKPLIAALKDEDGEVREQVAEILGALGDPRAVKPLIAALRDKAWWVQRQAAGALRALGDLAVEPLIAALKDKAGGVGWEAAEILGALGDPRAVEPLIAALKDGDRGMQRQAAGALRALGDPRAVEPLIAALKDEDEGEDPIPVQ